MPFREYTHTHIFILVVFKYDLTYQTFSKPFLHYYRKNSHNYTEKKIVINQYCYRKN